MRCLHNRAKVQYQTKYWCFLQILHQLRLTLRGDGQHSLGFCMDTLIVFFLINPQQLAFLHDNFTVAITLSTILGSPERTMDATGSLRPPAYCI